MAPLASSSSLWIPEDDLLLKNAVEAGASLEALAKGAVQFSRKFTIQELRDRWHSLLYNPAVSHKASARMTEFELLTSILGSKLNRNGNSNESVEVPVKRKVESIRKLYYSLQKRTCRRPSNSIDQNFLHSQNINDCVGYGRGSQEQIRHSTKPSVESLMLGDCAQNHFEFQEMDVDILHDGPPDDELQASVRKNFINAVPVKVPSWSGNESIKNNSYDKSDAPKDTPCVVGESVNEFRNSPGGQEVRQSHTLPDNTSLFHATGYSSPQPGVPLWKTIEDISAPSMPVDVSHRNGDHNAEETLPALDVMGDEKVTSCAYDVVHSGPVSVLKDRYTSDGTINTCAVSESDMDLSESLLNFANEDELPLMDADEKTTTDKSCSDCLNPVSLSTSDNVCEEDVPDVKEAQNFVSNKIFVNPDAFPTDANMPSSTTVPHPSSPPELHDEMECGWNTEDTEIPCNDHILLGKSFVSSIVRIHRGEIGDLASSVACRRQNSGQKEGILAESFTASQMVGSQMPGMIKNYLHGHGVKREFPDDNHNAKVSVQPYTGHGVPTQWRSAPSVPDSAADVRPKTELLNAKADSTTREISKPEANPSSSDPEESLILEESENDGDIPCFSDIEAMILEMDLCPDEPDSCISREVTLKFQDEATKRTIIRLEQSAQSSMQRSIASQGAFAMLYGHHMKHYIKETKVVLGRATRENDVDIDLGREGPANKISRQQAIIKLESDGSFILENLGKSSIFLNGVEVETRQCTSLGSSSLIEIRDMSFMFEINHKAVRQYLSKIAQTNHEEKTKFEWSEEGVP